MSPAHPSCSGYHLVDPQLDFDDRIHMKYSNWLEKQGKPSSNADAMYAYLRLRKICIDFEDPKDCPGLHHAAKMITNCALEKLEKKAQEELRECLQEIHVEHVLRGLFLVGDQITEDWQIVSQISDAVGHFNRGIYICKDLTQKHAGGGVLKVLPTWRHHPGYGSREIRILEVLEGLPNIIQMYEFHEPDYEDLAPWTITDYCNGGTLQSFSDKMSKCKTCGVPELFLWHVLESLLTAAHACHTGPPDRHPGAWDPIFHRDIILGNIFLMGSVGLLPEQYPTVVLADFGCAIAGGEVEERGFKPEDLPQECPSAIPPEGPVASASADVWQIGLAVLRLAAETRLQYFDDEAADLVMVLKSLLNYIGDMSPEYMCDFRQLLTLCLADDPRDRPTAGEMLCEVQKRRAKLMESGKLKFEPIGP